MNCSKCGNDNPDTAKKCSNCGKVFTSDDVVINILKSMPTEILEKQLNSKSDKYSNYTFVLIEEELNRRNIGKVIYPKENKSATILNNLSNQNNLLVSNKKFNIWLIVYISSLLTLFVSSIIHMSHLIPTEKIVAISNWKGIYIVIFVILLIIPFYVLIFSESSKKNIIKELGLIILSITLFVVFLIITSSTSDLSKIADQAKNYYSDLLLQRLVKEEPKAYEILENPSSPYLVFDVSDNLEYNFFGTNDEQVLFDSYKNNKKENIIKSIVLIDRTYYNTGRMIYLDAGSVPEYRQKVFLSVVDVNSWKIIWKCKEPIIGPEAVKPPNSPGGGIVYLSAVYGDIVDENSIWQAIGRIPWSNIN